MKNNGNHKNTLYIVSHTHWDREWYMSHGAHNYRLVKFFDKLLDLLEKDKEYVSFHLDGQVLILNDYLNIRPEKRETINKHIADGRIKIGPNYILQDEYLISGEANVRNILYGIKESEQYGKPTMIGYFPDAFGNISQLPQILKGFDIDKVFFGRGIIPIAYANKVLDTVPSDDAYSEIIWEGADGSRVIGVQFPMWYDNAKELPVQPEESKKRINKIVGTLAPRGKTPYLLGLNGSDHQPVQLNLTEALKVANSVQDVPVIHTTLEDYLEIIKPYKDTFYTFKGEIAGQNGNGKTTLINTASSRIYQKQISFKAAWLLESVAEPLSVLADTVGITYDYGLLYNCWLRLLENYPHDSICGCSVDSVGRKVDVRFDDVIDTVTSLIADLKTDICKHIDLPGEKNIVVFNTDTQDVCDNITATLEYREDEKVPEHFCILDSDNNEIAYTELCREDKNLFKLHYDSFREVYAATLIDISFRAPVKGGSYSVFRVMEAKSAQNPSKLAVIAGDKFMENKFVRLDINDNGTFNLFDKRSGITLKNQNYFEEVGDSGNEYDFKRSGNTYDTLGDLAQIEIIRKGAEQAALRVTNKLAQQDGTTAEIFSYITLKKDNPLVHINTEFVNNCKNHRISAMFDSPFTGKTVLADGAFDMIERTIQPGPKWENPENPQRMTAFVAHKDNNDGFLVAVRGLNEYEMLREKSTMRITLVRGVGEMGDWFYFPTEDSQCLGQIRTQYAVGLYGSDSENQMFRSAYVYNRPALTACTVPKNSTDKVLPGFPFVETDGLIVQSACKRAEDGNGYIVRLYNPGTKPAEFKASTPFILCKLNEKLIDGKTTLKSAVIAPKQIVTLRFSR